jgi:hypothetical protein
MIDWQVQVDGKYPRGWDQHRDGCWFPDFAYQEYLLPFFDVGGEVIDPYDGGVYREEDLKRLRKRLECWRSVFESKPTSWTVTDSSSHDAKHLVLERKIVLAIFEKTIRMIDIALSKGGVLVFRGD